MYFKENLPKAMIIRRLKLNERFLRLALSKVSSEEFIAALTYKKKKRFAILHQRARKTIWEYLKQATSVVKAKDIHAHVT